MKPRSPLSLAILLFLVLFGLAACRARVPAATAGTRPTPSPTAGATPAAQGSSAGGTSSTPRTSGPVLSTPTTVIKASPLALGSPPVPAADALPNYLAQVEYKQVTQGAAPSVDTWVAMDVRYGGQPAPGAYDLKVVDKSRPAAPVHMILAGSDAYILAPNQGGRWLKVPIEPGSPAAVSNGLLDPNRLARTLPPDAFTRANLVNAHEQAGGEDTAHYRIAGPSLVSMLRGAGDNGELVSGKADVWVSYAGRYVKQLALDVTTREAGGRQVQQTGSLLVTPQSAPLVIATPLPAQVIRIEGLQAEATPGSAQPPRGTPGGQATPTDPLGAIPAPPQVHAISMADLPGSVRDVLGAYATPGAAARTFAGSATPTQVFDFYRSRVPALGWKEIMRQAGGGAGQPWLLLFNRGAQDLQIVIVPDAVGGSAILIQVNE